MIKVTHCTNPCKCGECTVKHVCTKPSECKAG